MANEIRLSATTVLSLILIILIDRAYWLLNNSAYIILFIFVFPCIYIFLGTTPIVNLFSSFDVMNSGDRTNNTRQSIGDRHMISARHLELKPCRPKPLGAEHNLWKIVPQRDQSSFREVAELSIPESYDGDRKMEIKGKVQWRNLSQETNYAAYLIFKTMANATGLDNLLEASINSTGIQLPRKKIVSINRTNVRPRDKSIGLPKKREPVDACGWMEMKLGTFYCDVGPGEEVIILKDSSNVNKKGLIVTGIELRPI